MGDENSIRVAMAMKAERQRHRRLSRVQTVMTGVWGGAVRRLNAIKQWQTSQRCDGKLTSKRRETTRPGAINASTHCCSSLAERVASRRSPRRHRTPQRSTSKRLLVASFKATLETVSVTGEDPPRLVPVGLSDQPCL